MAYLSHVLLFHDVVVANRRGPDALRDLLADLGEQGRAGSVEEAARFGDVVTVATRVTAFSDLPPDAFAGFGSPVATGPEAPLSRGTMAPIIGSSPSRLAPAVATPGWP